MQNCSLKSVKIDIKRAMDDLWPWEFIYKRNKVRLLFELRKTPKKINFCDKNSMTINCSRTSPVRNMCTGPPAGKTKFHGKL